VALPVLVGIAVAIVCVAQNDAFLQSAGAQVATNQAQRFAVAVVTAPAIAGIQPRVI